MARLYKFDVRTAPGAPLFHGQYSHVASVKAVSEEAAVLAAVQRYPELAGEALVATRRAPPLKYEARWSDGTVSKRSSASHRDYTHAWRLGRIIGFSGSLQLAQAELSKRIGWANAAGLGVHHEIVPAVLVVRVPKKEG